MVFWFRVEQMSRLIDRYTPEKNDIESIYGRHGTLSVSPNSVYFVAQVSKRPGMFSTLPGMSAQLPDIRSLPSIPSPFHTMVLVVIPCCNEIKHVRSSIPRWGLHDEDKLRLSPYASLVSS